MTDLARRGALRLLGMTGLGASVGLAMPATKASGLALGGGLNALTPDVQCASIGNNPFPYWKREQLQGMLMHVPGLNESVPAHIAALKSVKPWAKLMMTRNHQEQRRTFIDRVDELCHKGIIG